jgi:hypothetical protein
MRVLPALKSVEDMTCAIALLPKSRQAAIAVPLSRLIDFFMVIPLG